MTVKKSAVAKSVAKSKKVTALSIVQEKYNADAKRALELKRQFKTTAQIARELDLTEREVSAMTTEAIRKAAMLVDEGAKQEILSLELESYDMMQQAVYQDALMGDVKAIETVLKISAMRTKILGIDNNQASNVTNNTIVVSGTSEEYVNALRKVAELPVIKHEEQ